MKNIFWAVSLLALSAPALAKLPCDELKSTIEAKIQAKGVKGYTLEVLAKDAKSEARVVGTCDGGASKIIYKKN